MNIKNIIFFEQYKELYANYLIIKPVQNHRDFTCKEGGLIVTVTADKRDYGQVRKGN